MASTDLRNIDANAVVTGFRASGGVLNSVKLTDGQILVGDTGDQPHAATITSDGSVNITGGPGTLTLTVARPYNFVFNSDYEIWGSGTSSAPTGWTLNGAGASVAKNTTAGQFRFGRASAALTRAGTDCFLTQDVAAIWPTVASWQNQIVGIGGWVYATAASRASIFWNDGINSGVTAFHSGGSTLEFLSTTFTAASTATGITVGLGIQTGNTTATIDGLIVAIGASVSGWVPSGWSGRKSVLSFSVGASTLGANPTYYGLGRADVTAVNADYVRPPFKCVARNLRASSDTATSTTDLLYDVSTPAATALSATFAAGFTADDTTHEVELAQMKGYVIKSTEAAGFRHTATIEVEEIP